MLLFIFSNAFLIFAICIYMVHKLIIRFIHTFCRSAKVFISLIKKICNKLETIQLWSHSKKIINVLENKVKEHSYWQVILVLPHNIIKSTKFATKTTCQKRLGVIYRQTRSMNVKIDSKQNWSQTCWFLSVLTTERGNNKMFTHYTWWFIFC